MLEDTDSESYSDSEDTEGDLVEELVEINPSMNGFCSLS